jgi:hypothetical protein
MKNYVVKTKSNRRLIVTATTEEAAKRQVENGMQNKCPWSGKAQPAAGEPVESVHPLGTFVH